MPDGELNSSERPRDVVAAKLRGLQRMGRTRVEEARTMVENAQAGIEANKAIREQAIEAAARLEKAHSDGSQDYPGMGADLVTMYHSAVVQGNRDEAKRYRALMDAYDRKPV